MTRVVLCAVLSASVVACGGSPSAPSTVERFPNIIGTWSGTRTDDLRLEDGSTRNNGCDEVWTVTSQVDGSLAG